jgi:hypothetical protein
MATYQWTGAVNTSASNAANWLPPTGVPAAGDVMVFDNNAVGNCIFDIAPPGGTTLTVDEIIVESTFIRTLSFSQTPRIKGLYLDGTLTTGGGSNRIDFQIGSSPNFYGTYKSYAERFVLLGDTAVTTGFDFNFYGDGTQVTKFDDGPHPTVTLGEGKFAPDYVAPTGTSGKASFVSLALNDGGSGSTITFAPDGDLVDNDRLKVFSMQAFTTTETTLDFGLATAEYYATSGGFYIPTEGATGYPTGFTAYHRKIVLKANTAGHKCLMADNTFISVEEFEIGDGVVLKGPVDATSQGADIRSIQTPKIRGTWSFSQISQGIYRSPRHASGPMPKVAGNFHITGKLDVDGLIDPTGLELNPVGSNPGGTAANTLWLNSGDSNKLYHGSSEVGGSGGITALTGDVTASGSGSVAATIANDSVNDDKLANSTLAKVDGALPKAGGTMTGEIEATTITLNAVPADPATDDKVRIGESGAGTNYFMVRTNDGYVQLGPNNTGYAHFITDRDRFYFNKDIIIDSGYVMAYNDGLKLGTGDSGSGGTTAITIANGSQDISVAGSISEGGTALSAKYAPPVQIMKFNKTGTSNVDSNLTYEIANNQASLIAVGSNQWTEVTAGTTHSSMEITADYGVKFLETGIYQITTGFYLHSAGSVTGGITALFRCSTTAPDPSQTGYYPSGGATIDEGFNRFDIDLNSQNLSLDPDFTLTFNVTAPNKTVYFYCYVNGIGSTTWRIRGHASEPLSQFTVVRLGNVQS